MTDEELKGHINALDAKSKENLSDHADAADHENHPSFHAIKKWLVALGTVAPPAGLVWKAAKFAKRRI